MILLINSKTFGCYHKLSPTMHIDFHDYTILNALANAVFYAYDQLPKEVM